MQNIDKSRWNELLCKSTTDIHNIFQTCEWANIIENCYNQSARFAIFEDDHGLHGGYLYFRKQILRIFCAYESFGGPLCNNERSDIIEYHAINQLLNEYCESHPRYILTRPSIQSGSDSNFVDRGFIKTRFYTFVIDTAQKEDAIWSNLRKNARNGVRKAEKSDISVSSAESSDEWSEFYRLHVEHSHDRGIASKPIDFFRIIYEEFVPKGMSKLFIARNNGVIIGGKLLLCFNRVATYYIGASYDEYSKYSPDDLILWHAILWCNKNGFSMLDLGDSWPDPNSHLYGIHKFKEKWGGSLIHRDFYIHGRLYRFGRQLVLDNRIIQRFYEGIHEKRWF